MRCDDFNSRFELQYICNIMGGVKSSLFLAINSATVHNEVVIFEFESKSVHANGATPGVYARSEGGIAYKIFFKKKWLANRDEAAKILQNIKIGMKKSKKRFSDLNAIFTVTGPGGFTGLRVGIAIVNAIAWSQKIPVYHCDALLYSKEKIPDIIKSCKKSNLVKPFYLREPQITKSNRHSFPLFHK